jgi:hypothetical protein
MRALEFRRRLDPVCYRFSPVADATGGPAWKRDDRDLWLVRRAGDGWVVVDGANVVLSRPWNTLPSSQGELPPEGEWISKKGDRSYVYDLCFV